VLQQRTTKKSPLLSERLHSLLEILKIHEARLLDCVQEQQISFLSSWEQWCFSMSKCKEAFWFHLTNWCEGLHKAIILRLKGGFATRKSSNEHVFFVTVTSLNKVAKRRIRDLIGNVLFPVNFKCVMLIAIKKDPRSYLCIIPHNVLMCIENRADLPRPWTKVLTS